MVSLHNGLPALAPTYTASSNTNETLESAEVMGAAYNAVLGRSGSTAGRTANYQGAEVGCGADNTSPDVVHKFTLAQPTRVRVSAEGSSFDTVIALVGDTCGGAASTPPPATDTSGSNAVSNASRTFLAGSLVIPMDTTHQNIGMLRAYGLVYTLLKNDIPVSWVVKKSKSSGEADFTASATNYVTSTPVTGHGYRGGPFVIDSTDVARAATHVGTYLTANPTVVVHRTTTNFDAYVRRQLTGAPRFALMRDGSEATARTYLAAAGIPDSAGTAWPDAAPDVKTLTQLAGASTAAFDGALFDGAGTPAYCGLLSAGWTTAGSATAQGLEVVRETRQFLESPTSLFAQNGGAAAFENATGGRFITLDGYKPATAPTGLFELNLDSPFAQIDGALASSGGTNGAIALFELDDYKDNDATIFGKNDGSPGEADVWVTARLDGECSILDDSCAVGQAQGFVSYLAGNAYSVLTPVGVNPQSNGVRLFLNAMFATECATKEQRPAPTVLLTGASATTTANNTYTLTYNNDGEGNAHGAVLEYTVPTGASYVSSTGGGVLTGSLVQWALGSLAPDESGSKTVTVSYPAFGSYALRTVRYTQGNTSRSTLSWVSRHYTMSGDLGCTALGVTSRVPATNDNQASAYNMGELKGRIFRLTGSTATMAADYSTAETGTTCNAAANARDAAYYFHLNQPANVTISTESTSGWDRCCRCSTATSRVRHRRGDEHGRAYEQRTGPRKRERQALLVERRDHQLETANYDLADIGCTAEPTSPDACIASR